MRDDTPLPVDVLRVERTLMYDLVRRTSARGGQLAKAWNPHRAYPASRNDRSL